MSFDDREEEVVPLHNDASETFFEPERPPSAPGKLHGWAITGMALSALAGIASMLSFVTVRWPDGPRRVVIGILIASLVGFLACASAAVFAAARDTYPRDSSEGGGQD